MTHQLYLTALCTGTAIGLIVLCIAYLLSSIANSLSSSFEALALTAGSGQNTSTNSNPDSSKPSPSNKPSPVPLFVSLDPLRVWDNVLLSDVWGPLVRPAYETYDSEAFMA